MLRTLGRFVGAFILCVLAGLMWGTTSIVGVVLLLFRGRAAGALCCVALWLVGVCFVVLVALRPSVSPSTPPPSNPFSRLVHESYREGERERNRADALAGAIGFSTGFGFMAWGLWQIFAQM